MKKLYLLSSIGFMMMACPVRADSTQAQGSFSVTSGFISSTTTTVTVPSFNSNLGTLTSVQLTLAFTLDTTVTDSRGAFTNLVLDLPYRLYAGSSTLGGQISSDTVYTTPISGTNGTYTPTVNYSYPTFNLPAADLSVSQFTLQTLPLARSGGNVADSGTIPSGTITLTYDYVAAPEPSSWALTLGGVAFLVWCLRVRRISLRFRQSPQR